jgi:Leucine-rich repeat (LRR) protein
VSKLDPELFSCLSNLEKLDLEYNNLRSFDLKILEYIVNIKEMAIIF